MMAPRLAHFQAPQRLHPPTRWPSALAFVKRTGSLMLVSNLVSPQRSATIYLKGWEPVVLMEWLGNECYCGNKLTSTPASTSDCSMKCAGKSTEYCGAGYKMNVYQSSTATTPT